MVDSLPDEGVYALALMSMSGFLTWWSANYLNQILFVRVFAAMGVICSIWLFSILLVV